MRVALAQINTTIGAFDANVTAMVDAAQRAKAAGVRLVIFPELAISGYPPRDLLQRRGFVDAGKQALERLARDLPRGISAVVGHAEPNLAPEGRPLSNAAVLVEHGRTRTVHRKCLLPSYDVFDEDRYFEPARDVGKPLEIDGVAFGFSVCEDMWSAADVMPRQMHRADPLAALVAAGAAVLVNISASPYHRGKPALRQDLVSSLARRHHRPLLFCNAVGGNDDLIFDGGSLVADAGGALVGRGAHGEEDLVIVDLDATETGGVAVKSRLEPAPDGEPGEVAAALVLGTRDYVRKCGFDQALVGLSGGIDSALTASIAAAALGPDRVLGVAMPSRFSSPGSLADARDLASNLGIGWREIPIEPAFEAYLKILTETFDGRPWDTTEENLQARIRGDILMALSNKLGAIVLSTGNKSELAVGYCTLYGDMCGGLAVISDLPKMAVYELSRWFNRHDEVIPAATLEKPPSAELRPDQLDQDSLPPYPVLDEILHGYVEAALSPSELAAAGHDPATVHKVIQLVDQAEYKRNQAPPGLRVTTKAFGSGRRYPIAKRLDHVALPATGGRPVDGSH